MRNIYLEYEVLLPVKNEIKDYFGKDNLFDRLLYEMDSDKIDVIIGVATLQICFIEIDRMSEICHFKKIIEKSNIDLLSLELAMFYMNCIFTHVEYLIDNHKKTTSHDVTSDFESDVEMLYIDLESAVDFIKKTYCDLYNEVAINEIFEEIKYLYRKKTDDVTGILADRMLMCSRILDISSRWKDYDACRYRYLLCDYLKMHSGPLFFGFIKSINNILSEVCGPEIPVGSEN
jgi:hypothetical protein